MASDGVGIKASQHDSYGTFTLLAILLPFVGIVLGIVYLAKDSKLDKKLGEHVLALGVLFSFILWPISVWLLYGAFFSPQNIVPTATYEPSYSAPIKQVSTWDYQAAYDKIETGMTKPQVETATGKTSASCSESEVNGYKAESCTYGDYNDPGIVVVQYGNGLVVSKAKQAL